MRLLALPLLLLAVIARTTSGLPNEQPPSGLLSCYSGDAQLFELRHGCSATARKELRRLWNASRWWRESQNTCRRLERTVLVVGDSVDTQLFHAIEHAVGQTTRSILRRGGGNGGSGSSSGGGGISAISSSSRIILGIARGVGRPNEERVLSHVDPSRGGGAVAFCRDNSGGIKSLSLLQNNNSNNKNINASSSPPPQCCEDIFATRRVLNRTVDYAVVGLGRYRHPKRLTDATYAKDVDRLLSAVRAAGVEPIFKTIPATNLLADGEVAFRRRLNALGEAVAAKLNVTVARLHLLTDRLLLENARRLALPDPPTDAFRPVGPRFLLAGACRVSSLSPKAEKPMKAAPGANATGGGGNNNNNNKNGGGSNKNNDDINDNDNGGGSGGRWKRCSTPEAKSKSDHLLMRDGAHWCPDAIAGWGAVVLDAVDATAAARKENLARAGSVSVTAASASSISPIS